MPWRFNSRGETPMTEDKGWVVGTIIGFLVATAAWIAIFVWYFHGATRYELINLAFFLPFTPWVWIAMLVISITSLAAAFGGGALGVALARRSMARD
jgi:hypothetical protein